MKNMYKRTENEEIAKLLKALAHPVRLCIVRGLLQKGSCNVSYMEDCLKISQSSISQHLAKLRAAGIVKDVRNGNKIEYEVCNETVSQIIKSAFKE